MSDLFTNPVILILLALAVFRLTRLVLEDTILDNTREAVWAIFPPESTKVGYLLTCPWCVSIWIAAIYVLLYLLLPTAMIIVAAVLALSAVASIISERT